MELTELRPYLEVADVQGTADFWVERLGFEVTGTFDDGAGTVTWVGLRRDRVGVMFAAFHTHDDAESQDDHVHGSASLSGSLYVTVDDVDAVADDLRGRGTAIAYGPVDEPYGMREVGVADPNGYFVVFGAPTDG